MITVDIQEAKARLSELIDQAVNGEPFIITSAGKPVVKVTALDAPVTPRRLGFMDGQITVPEDFNRMGEGEIEAMFGRGAEARSGRRPDHDSLHDLPETG